MSVRVSRSNRVAQPASPGIRAPGMQKLARSKSGWWTTAGNRLDGMRPGFFADFLNLRYALGNNGGKTLADLVSVSNASAIRTYVDQTGARQVAQPNSPRIDWSSGLPELLLEGAATNLCAYGWNLPIWGGPNITLTDTGLAGLLPGEKFYKLTRAVNLNAYKSITMSTPIAIGQKVRLKARLKTDDNGYGCLRLAGSYPDRVDAVINLATGAVAYAGATNYAAPVITVTPVASGEYDVELQTTVVNSACNQIIIGPSTAASGVWEGMNLPAASCFITGVQVEVGVEKIGSYISTNGSAVTRPADLCQLTAAAAAVLQGAGMAVAWRGRLPSKLTSEHMIAFPAGTLALARNSLADDQTSSWNGAAGVASGSAASDRLSTGFGAVFGAGAAGTAMGLSSSGAAVLGALTLSSYGSRSSIFIGPTGGLAAGQIIRLRQLVGWALSDRPSTGGVEAQARIAA